MSSIVVVVAVAARAFINRLQLHHRIKPGTKFLFNPKGAGLDNANYIVKADVLLDNWHLKADRLVLDVLAMVLFTIFCLICTFVVLAKSQFRR